MSLLHLIPKEKRPRACAGITVLCVLIHIGIGVGLYFGIFAGTKGEAEATPSPAQVQRP